MFSALTELMSQRGWQIVSQARDGGGKTAVTIADIDIG